VPVLNAQAQEPIVHAPSFTLVRARADQAVRAGALPAKDAADVASSSTAPRTSPRATAPRHGPP
jgi:hypothetical protein